MGLTPSRALRGRFRKYRFGEPKLDNLDRPLAPLTQAVERRACSPHRLAPNTAQRDRVPACNGSARRDGAPADSSSPLRSAQIAERELIEPQEGLRLCGCRPLWPLPNRIRPRSRGGLRFRESIVTSIGAV
jgi:hypothetical protein